MSAAASGSSTVAGRDRDLEVPIDGGAPGSERDLEVSIDRHDGC